MTERRKELRVPLEGRRKGRREREKRREGELIEERNKRRRALDASHRVTMMEAVYS